MSDTSFTYSIYIRTTPAALWRALTDPEWTQRWWKVSFRTDWTPGSVMAVEQSGVVIEDDEQVVLESEPFTHLSYTWHTFTPEWAAVHGFSDEFLAVVSAEPRSRATYDIHANGDVVQLTVTHDGFEPDSTVLVSISDGWPPLLSNLKTLLETGTPLIA